MPELNMLPLCAPCSQAIQLALCGKLVLIYSILALAFKAELHKGSEVWGLLAIADIQQMQWLDIETQ